MNRIAKVTLVELLVVIAIVGILAITVFNIFGPGAFRIEEYSTAGKVVRKYYVVKDNNSYYRIDVEVNGNVETYDNYDNPLWSKYNSTEINANLKEGNWYNFRLVGKRVQYRDWCPNIISATPMTDTDKLNK